MGQIGIDLAHGQGTSGVVHADEEDAVVFAGLHPHWLSGGGDIDATDLLTLVHGDTRSGAGHRGVAERVDEVWVSQLTKPSPLAGLTSP